MSDGASDFGQNVLGMSKQDAQALSAVSSVIGVVSGVWGYFNTAKSILQLLGLFSGADRIQQLQQAIDQLAAEFQTLLAEVSTHETMLSVAVQTGMSRTALQELQESAPDDAATLGINPAWDGLRPIVDNESLQPVNTLAQEAYWLRPFFPELVYTLPSGYQLPPPPASGQIFDYRWTLPAYLEAISIRLTFVVAAIKDYSKTHLPELNTMAATLETYFNQIRSAILEIGPPIQPGDAQDPGYPGAPYTTGDWQRVGAPFGAFEYYSTFHLVGPWPSSEYPIAASSADNAFGRFQVRFMVRSLRNWKQVFSSISLPAAAATLINLKAMAEISPAVIGPGDNWTYHTTGDWSVQELAQRLAQIWSAYRYGYPVLASQRADGTYGPISGPISLRQVLQALQTFNPQPYTSLRSALAQ